MVDQMIFIVFKPSIARRVPVWFSGLFVRLPSVFKAKVAETIVVK